MPAYAVYIIESNTGTVYADKDIPEKMTLLACCDTVNSHGARTRLKNEIDGRQVAVFRLNTIVHYATNPNGSP